jgi:hypothetical protein
MSYANLPGRSRSTTHLTTLVWVIACDLRVVCAPAWVCVSVRSYLAIELLTGRTRRVCECEFLHILGMPPNRLGTRPSTVCYRRNRDPLETVPCFRAMCELAARMLATGCKCSAWSHAASDN